MPEGLQDWYLRNQINIIAQDVAELIQRPKHGKAQLNDIKVTCPAGEQVMVAEVNGRGVTYSGNLRIQGGPGSREDEIHLYIEDEHVIYHSYTGLFYGYAYKPWRAFFYLQQFDDTYYGYTVGIQPGITFESQFRIEYKNNDDSDVYIAGELAYALL